MPRISDSWRVVLVFSEHPASRARVRRAYAEYRRIHNIPDRCDNVECQFHTQPLEWNGQPLPLILDHRDGVRHDNRPKCLRYLCPNCDAQLPTRGGKNRGRVSISSGGFAVKRPDGKRDYTLVAETGHFRSR